MCPDKGPAPTAGQNKDKACSSLQLCLHPHSTILHPGIAGRLPETLHPWARLLQGLQGTALTLHMQSGGCRALHLLTFSQASVCSHPQRELREQARVPTPSSPTSPQGSEGTHCFSPKPHIPTSNSHAHLVHAFWGGRLGSLPPYFITSPLLLTALPLPPNHLPQHLHPPSTGLGTVKTFPLTSFYKGGRTSLPKEQGSSPVGC